MNNFGWTCPNCKTIWAPTVQKCTCSHKPFEWPPIPFYPPTQAPIVPYSQPLPWKNLSGGALTTTASGGMVFNYPEKSK